MNIGLDWDGTVTSDPELFFNFAMMAKLAGHKVYIVTMRYPSECKDIGPEWKNVVEGVFPTGNSKTQTREAKANHMLSKGIRVHVWIDDNPEAIYHSGRQIWGDFCSPEGTVIVAQHD